MTALPKFTLRPSAAAAMLVVALALGGLAGCGGGTDTVAVAVAPPPLIGAESTGSKVLSWFALAADTLYDVALGIASLAEHNPLAAGAEFTAAGLGIVGKILEDGGGDATDTQAQQLTNISTQLDTLTVNVNALSTQLTQVISMIDGLGDSFTVLVNLNAPIKNAENWLTAYSTGQYGDMKSREWARWYLAGCDPTLVSSCPATANPVTAARMNTFSNLYMKNPGPTFAMTDVKDNFPRWWSQSVVGNNTINSANYAIGGFLAADLVTQLYEGITDNKGTPQNALLSYMNYLIALGSNNCSVDITDPGCDLNTNVYQPLESYFAYLVSLQTQLVMAQSEAYLTLAQIEVKASPVLINIEDTANYLAHKDLMAGFAIQLNEEAEVFLQVAEEIALYRAADGRTDWSNFAATDAGKLLARADFSVAQLAGKNYRTASTIPAFTVGYVNPPWPSSGIVGRVFYANGEQMPTGTRMLAMDSTVGAQYQPNQSLSEDDTSKRAVTGVLQPYLLWTRSVDAKGAVTMIGTANTQWSVRRLVAQPITLPIGLDFQVTSSQPTRLGAKLGLYNYDENFVTPPGSGTSSVIPFGSFSSVEGNIGGAGLALDPGSIKADMNATLYDASYNASTINAGAVSLSVTYVPNKDYKPGNSDLWGGKGMTAGTWSVASTAVKLVIPPKGATAVKISWPSVVNVSLDSDRQILGGLGGNGVGREEYYSYVKFQQHILDSKGKALTGGSVVNDRCTSSPFFKCQIDNSQIDSSQSVDLTMLTAAATAANLSFAANFSTEVEQYNERMVWFSKYATVRTSIAPSVASWQIQAPMLTLIR